MSERLNLQDLIDLLALKQEVTKKEAETFLRELINLIEENIGQGESIKIRDFGTFKLVKINTRRSVDVNTGDAIEIPVHYRLSFSPEKSLKEAINRPFAHFETVILEDGVAFEHIESEIEGTVSDDEDADEAVSMQQPPLLPINNMAEEQQPVTVDRDVIPAESSISKHIKIVKREEIFGSETYEPAVFQNLSEEPPLVVEPETEVTIDDLSVETQKEIVYTDDYYDTPPRSYIRKVILFVAVIATMLGVVYFDDLRAFISKIHLRNIVARTILNDGNPTTDKTNKQDSIDIANKRKQDSIANLLKSEPAIDTAIQKAEHRYTVNNSHQTETIKPGQTLRLISLKHYGHKSFWVYIYEENRLKIQNPNSVPLGTELIIPLAEKYAIDPNNPESVKKAIKLEMQLIAKYRYDNE